MTPFVALVFSKSEADALARLLRQASRDCATACCNDFPMENTPAAWLLHQELQAFSENKTLEQWLKTAEGQEPRPTDACLYLPDFALMDYFAARIESRIEGK